MESIKYLYYFTSKLGFDTKKIIAFILLLISTIAWFTKLPTLDDDLLQKNQYQSYRMAILSADTLKQTGSLLIFSQGNPGNNTTFQASAEDDMGYPLYLSLLVGLGIIDFNEDKIQALKTATIDKSRDLLREHFSHKTYIAGPLWFSLCLLVVGGLLIHQCRRDYEFLFPLSFILSVFFLQPLISPSFCKVMHSHSLVPGVCILSLALPLLLSGLTADKKRNLIRISPLLAL